MTKANTTPASKEVDAYIASFPKPLQAALEQLRQCIRKLAPEAQEQISYKIACYKHQGMLVGFGATENQCSFYLCHATILDSFKEKLKGFKYSGGTIHFSPKKPVPFALVKKLVQQRIKQNESLAAAKKKSRTEMMKPPESARQ